MRNWFIILLSIFYNYFGICQQMSVIYEYSNSNNSKWLYELIIEESRSFYIQSEVNLEVQSVDKFENRGIMYKNKTDNIIAYNDRLFKNNFFVKDSLPNFNWEFKVENKYILGVLCNSAKTKFRGKEYIAYYSESFENQEGPWKFGGLPGLILEVVSIDGEYMFKAISIKQHSEPLFSLDEFLGNSFLNWNTYIQKFRNTVDAIVLKMKEKDNSGGDGYFKLNKLELIYPEAQLNDGIKF